MNQQQAQLQQQIAALTNRLKGIDERLTNPMASEETIRELIKTKNELIADKQGLEIKLDKIKPQRSFERTLNESFEL